MRKAVKLSLGGVPVVVAVVAGGWLWWRQIQGSNEMVNSAGGSIALDVDSDAGAGAIQLGEGAEPMPNRDQGLAVVSDGSGLTRANENTPSVNELKDYEHYKTSQTALYGDLAAGSGASVGAGSKVTLNYRGWLTNGNLFDESYSKGRALAFTIGEHKVIPGFEQGMVGMKAGGKRRLIIPPAAGYGEKAVGSIPAGSVLVFDVELIEVKQ